MGRLPLAVLVIADDLSVPLAEGHDAGWHLFNDFSVRAVTEEEALSFPGTWKVSKPQTHRGSCAEMNSSDSCYPILSTR